MIYKNERWLIVGHWSGHNARIKAMIERYRMQEDAKVALRKRIDNEYGERHALNAEQEARLQHVKVVCKNLSLLIVDCTYVSREQSLALTAIGEAYMYVRQAIEVQEA